MPKLLIALLIILVLHLVIGGTGLTFFIPTLIVGYAVAVSPQHIVDRVVLATVFAASLVAIGEDPTRAVAFATLAIIASLAMQNARNLTRASIAALILVIIEFMIQLPTLSLIVFAIFTIRLFLAPLLSLTLINTYAPKKV